MHTLKIQVASGDRTCGAGQRQCSFFRSGSERSCCALFGGTLEPVPGAVQPPPALRALRMDACLKAEASLGVEAARP